MRWYVNELRTVLSIGEAFRRQHSRWLTRAIQEERRYPRIPVRPVHEGGFDRLCATPAGREIARRWWEHALDLVDD